MADRIRLSLLLGPLAALLSVAPARAADHGDSPLLTALPRHDARIADFYAFTRGDNLVLAVTTDTAIPAGLASYRFPEDLTLRLAIDNDSPVSFEDPEEVRVHGGTLLAPQQVSADVVLEFTFDAEGAWHLHLEGLGEEARPHLQVFAGLRDDAFIRGPRQGRNIAALVVELPLRLVQREGGPLLLWSTSKIPDVHGPISEHGGRALRSMFPENDGMNTREPRDHYRELGLRPDVVILDPRRPAGYPNGRLLTDDVVDLVGDPRPLRDDAPYPSTNDKPFLPSFPYLAEPHP